MAAGGNGGMGSFFDSAFSQVSPGYLVGTFPDEAGEFAHHQVHTFQAGLFQFADLFFYYSLKGQIGGEQPRSEGVRVMPVGRGRRSVEELKKDRKKGRRGRIKREETFS